MDLFTTIVKPLLKILAYMLPYALIPLTFKFAGGIFSTFTGMINDRSKGLFDRAKTTRAHKTERVGRQALAKRAGASRYLTEQASKGGFVRRKAFGAAAKRVGGYNIEAAMSARQAAVAKEVNDQIATGRDDDVRGLTVDKKFLGIGGYEKAEAEGLARTVNGKRQFKSLGGAWVDEANVRAGHQRWGNDRFAQQAALSYEMRKAMTNEQVGDLSSRYASVAKGWGMTDTEAGGAWIGSAFENQNQHLEYKATDWQTGQLKDGGTGFVNEIYEKKGNYPLAQMSAHTIEQLSNSYVAAQQTGDFDTQRKIREIAETFEFRTQQGEGGEPTGGPATRTGQGGQPQVSAPGAASVNSAVKNLHRLTRPAATEGPHPIDSTDSPHTEGPRNSDGSF